MGHSVFWNVAVLGLHIGAAAIGTSIATAMIRGVLPPQRTLQGDSAPEAALYVFCAQNVSFSAFAAAPRATRECTCTRFANESQNSHSSSCGGELEGVFLRQDDDRWRPVPTPLATLLQITPIAPGAQCYLEGALVGVGNSLGGVDRNGDDVDDTVRSVALSRISEALQYLAQVCSIENLIDNFIEDLYNVDVTQNGLPFQCYTGRDTCFLEPPGWIS